MDSGRWQLFYSEENLSKAKVESIKSLMGDTVIIPNIEDTVSYIYLKEGEHKNAQLLSSRYGLVATGAYESYDKISIFLESLQYHYDVGEIINIKSYGNLNFTILKDEGEFVTVKPHLRFNSSELIVSPDDIIESKEGKSYQVSFDPNLKLLALDIKYLEEQGYCESISTLFLFLIRIKFQFRGCNLCFFNGENGVISTLFSVFGFPYFTDKIPVAAYYFTDQRFLVYNGEYVIYMDGNNLALLEEDPECNAKLRHVVYTLIENNIIRELISDSTLKVIESGNEEEIMKRLHRYRVQIELELSLLSQLEFEFLQVEYPIISMSKFKDFVEACDLPWVRDNLDYYYNILYK